MNKLIGDLCAEDRLYLIVRTGDHFDQGASISMGRFPSGRLVQRPLQAPQQLPNILVVASQESLVGAGCEEFGHGAGERGGWDGEKSGVLLCGKCGLRIL